MTLTENYLPTSSRKRLLVKMTPTTLTIHSTGNESSTAKNERAWLENPINTSSTAYHMVVDERECILVVPFDEKAYHAGDGATGPGNSTSVGLEICESGDREKTLVHAAEVTAWFLQARGWDVSRLRQHYDWSGKNCPRILRDTGRWEWFVSEVKQKLQAKGEGSVTVDEAKKMVQEKASLEDQTMTFLSLYKYGDDLLVKLARAMQA